MMRTMNFKVAAALLLLAGCASNTVDMEEPKRLLGREENVRIDAEILSDRVGTGGNIGVTWEIQNLRDRAIAVADLAPQANYEPSSRTITINFGAEVPGTTVVPRLTVIAPGEKKSFSGGAKANVIIAPTGDRAAYPDRLRIRVNYLRDIGPFGKLIGIPERSINDPVLADELFAAWVENNESVTTNAIPIVWTGRQQDPASSRRRPFFD